MAYYRDSMYPRESYGGAYSGYYSRDDGGAYSYPQAKPSGYGRRENDVSGGAYTALYNPEYYDKERGYGYEGTVAGAINPSDDPMAKKRKIQNITICVDYIRGFCSKGARCPKPHVDYVESIDDREILAKVKFCHDFQNRGMCTRSRDCKFLHVTRREEDEFLLTGTIPKTVFTRMRQWAAENGLIPGGGYNEQPSPSSPRFGRGGTVGRKRSFSGSRSGGYEPYGSQGGRGGGGGGGGGGGKHSSSLPVTFGKYCVDFLKGTCAKGQSCSLKHVETVDIQEDREGIVKQVFCHDFQNGTCKRAFCKYVHASRQEENFFLENGFFPPSMNARNRDKLFFSNICLDALRNQCIRGASCQFQHVEKVEMMNERICLSRSIFCHDYQMSGCVRPNCKMIHTKREDEQHFLQTGSLPAHLRGGAGAQSSSYAFGDLTKIAGNVCREFVKNMCQRGNSCRYYHPSPAELEALLSQQNQLNPPIPAPVEQIPTQQDNSKLELENKALHEENQALKTRNQQLERLLADACYCMTLAVGDQNPAIATLMKTIAEMAPSSSLANQPDDSAQTAIQPVNQTSEQSVAELKQESM